MTDQTVVLPHYPPPHTLAVEDVAAGEAGGGGRHQVLLADLTDRMEHDGLWSVRLCGWTGTDDREKISVFTVHGQLSPR